MIELVAGLIDVFADAPLTGNPLAVVESADDLSDDQMRKIAGEFNQAETTFLMRSERAHWKLRSFTASGAEVSGAGHNALGAWLWLGEHGALGALDTPKTFLQEIGTDVLPIVLTRIDNRVHGRMRQSALRVFDALDDIAPLAKALGLDAGDILTDPPVRPANTGATHLMVRIANAEAVDKAKPNQAELFSILNATVAEGCYAYALDAAAPNAAYARFFNPTIGLWEDAATGTAAGPLAAYLAASGKISNDRLVIEQGTKMGRPSIMRVRLTPEPELSGSGVVVLRGALRL